MFGFRVCGRGTYRSPELPPLLTDAMNNSSDPSPAVASPNPDSEQTPQRQRAWKRWVLLLIVLLLLLLLLRGCDSDQPFDYFRHKADELGNDPDRALTWVRDEVETSPLRGNVRGALGTLWNNGGSPEEKQLLLDAVWQHCEPVRTTAGLDDVAPARDATQDGSEDAGTTFELGIVHRQWVGAAPSEQSDDAWRNAFAQAEVVDNQVLSAPIGHWIGDVHSVVATTAGETQLQLRTSAGVDSGQGEVTAVPTIEALGEALVFRVQRPNGEPLEVVRELWRADNRIGPAKANVGDRHDFVVLPCRIPEFVTQKERLLLEEADRLDAPEAHAYEGLLSYAYSSDEILAELELELEVRALFELPRILIVSTLKTEDGDPVYAMDLRLDSTSFSGQRANALGGALVRSLLESGIEHEWLQQWSGSETHSAFSTFNQLHTTYPNSTSRRVETIFDTLEALRDNGGAGAEARFGVASRSGAESTVTVRAAADGFRVSGGNLNPDFASALASREEMPALELQQGVINQSFADLGWAAWAVETVLLGAAGPQSVEPDFVLEAGLGLGTETTVAPSARFAFQWGDGEKRVSQKAQVRKMDEGLEYRFHVRRGLRTATGALTVTADAVANATRHDPQYRSGTATQNDATSFCVSKAVHASLAAGGSTPFALLAEYTDTDDPLAPRRVAWSGTLAAAGALQVTVQVNGAEETLPALRATLQGESPPFAELVILDDTAWPIGKAESLVSVETAAHGRLVDEDGLGIGGARIQLGEGEGMPSCVTWPDGRFRLPPAPTAPWGSADLQVEQKILDQQQTDLVQHDLTGVGLQEFEVTVPRLRQKVIWITPAQGEALAALPLSAQVRRHASGELAANRMVVIPEGMLTNGLRGTIGFYSYDPKTGDIIGITEDGLHGAMAGWQGYGNVAIKAGKAAIDGAADFGAATPLHAMRGANAAMFLFCAYRLGADSDTVAKRLLAEMEMWESRTNMFTQLEGEIGGDATDKYLEILGKASGVGGVQGDSARAAFYAGYGIALGFLQNQVR